ncbi:MAG: hypothetical protein D6805_10180 [Planctomycetota bacterium]|nr:MAG: hypothetical protein D6805_10180 [Planctomycetota bacterium]
MQGLQRKYQDFQQKDAAILAIVVDGAERNKAVKEKLGLTFEILSDKNLEVIPRYGMLHRNAPGAGDIARPGVFLLNRERKIIHRWLPDNYRVRTRPEAILDVIKKHSAAS